MKKLEYLCIADLKNRMAIPPQKLKIELSHDSAFEHIHVLKAKLK